MAKNYTPEMKANMRAMPKALAGALGLRHDISPPDAETGLQEVHVVSDGYDYEALGPLLSQLAEAWDALDSDMFRLFQSQTKRMAQAHFDGTHDHDTLPWIERAQRQISEVSHMLWLVLHNRVGESEFDAAHPAIVEHAPMLARIAADREHGITSEYVMALVARTYEEELLAFLEEKQIPQDSTTYQRFQRDYARLKKGRQAPDDRWLTEAYDMKRRWIAEISESGPTEYNLNIAGIAPEETDEALAILAGFAARLGVFADAGANEMPAFNEDGEFISWRQEINEQVMQGFDRLSPDYARHAARFMERGAIVMESGAGVVGRITSRVGADGTERDYSGVVAVNRHFNSLFTAAHEMGHMFQLSPGQGHELFVEFYSQFAENLLYLHEMDGVYRKRQALQTIGLGEADLREALHALDMLEAGLVQSQLWADSVPMVDEVPRLYLARKLDVALDAGETPSLFPHVRDTAERFGLDKEDSRDLYAGFAQWVSVPDYFRMGFVESAYGIPYLASRGLMAICRNADGTLDDRALRAMGERFMAVHEERPYELMLPEMVTYLAGTSHGGEPYTFSQILAEGAGAIERDLNRADVLAQELGVDIATHAFPPPQNPLNAAYNPEGPKRLWQEYRRGGMVMG